MKSCCIRRRSAHVLLALGLALAVAGCQSYREGAGRTYGEHWDDVSIRSAIKTRFIAAKEIRSLTIEPTPLNTCSKIQKPSTTIAGMATTE